MCAPHTHLHTIWCTALVYFAHSIGTVQTPNENVCIDLQIWCIFKPWMLCHHHLPSYIWTKIFIKFHVNIAYGECVCAFFLFFSFILRFSFGLVRFHLWSTCTVNLNIFNVSMNNSLHFVIDLFFICIFYFLFSLEIPRKFSA